MKTIQVEIKVLNDDGTILHETIAGIESLMVYYSDQIKPVSVAAAGGIRFYGTNRDVHRMMHNSEKIIYEGLRQHLQAGQGMPCRCRHEKH